MHKRKKKVQIWSSSSSLMLLEYQKIAHHRACPRQASPPAPGPAPAASLGRPLHPEPSSSVFTLPIPSFPDSLDQISHLLPERVFAP